MLDNTIMLAGSTGFVDKTVLDSLVKRNCNTPKKPNNLKVENSIMKQHGIFMKNQDTQIIMNFMVKILVRCDMENRLHSNFQVNSTKAHYLLG